MTVDIRLLKTLAGREFRSLYRDRIILLSAILIWSLLTIAMLFTYMQFRHAQHSREAANRMFREQWDQQERDPHAAAHFGTYIFKPLDPLAALDPGLNDYAGTTYHIEAHTQHDMDYSNAQSSDASMRFGQFSIAMVLQLIIPLLILLTTSSAVTTEKEAGTLKMLIIQCPRSGAIIWAKLWSYFLLYLCILLSFFIFLSFIPGGLMISVAYLLYYLLITTIGIIISTLSARSGAALLKALILWLCATVMIPKIVVSQAEKSYPVMPRVQFEDKVNQGFLKGINGNDPYYERANRLLKRYQADSTSHSPVNVSGIIMQYNEDYQLFVFNHYYKMVENGFSRQQSFINKASLLDPFIGLQRISMALSGTDLSHHNEFYRQARDYRNYFIRTLNMEMARHPEDYKAGTAFFKGIKEFRYHAPPGLPDIQTGLFSLGAWVIVALIFLYFISRHEYGYFKI